MAKETGIAINPQNDGPDEPQVDPRLAKIASDCWKKGNEAIPKENWDYAIDMYTKACKLVPHSLTYRHSLRATERKKYGDNGKGAAMAGMRLMGVRGKVKKAEMGKDWASLIEAAEEGLAVNPWDVSLLKSLGDGCAQLNYPDVAIFSYEEALKIDPQHIEINKALADILESRGEYKRAVSCWQRIQKADPNSGHARTRIQQLSAGEVIDRGGYGAAEGTRNVLSANNVGKSVAAEADGPGMSHEADLLRATRKDPENKDGWLRLAEYYRREGNLPAAEEHFSKAYELTGGKDHTIRELVEDVQLDQLRQELAKAKASAQTGDDESKRDAGRLAGELLRREVEVYSVRVERYPADMKLKFELGQRYMRVKNWKDAIPLFQQARGDVRIKGEALAALGKCFAYDGKIALARRQFETAVGEINVDDKPEVFKDVHYSLARLAEEMKDYDVAEEHYQIVIEVDYTFRDCVDRLDKMQSRDKGTA